MEAKMDLYLLYLWVTLRRKMNMKGRLHLGAGLDFPLDEEKPGLQMVFASYRCIPLMERVMMMMM